MFPLRLLAASPPRNRRAAAALSSFALASLIIVSTVALTGCGTGGDDNKTFNGGGGVITPSPSPSGATFAGRTYTARTITLQNGQTVAVTFTTKADGTATGTATINDPTRKASRLVISTPFLSGTYNPQTGAINLSGSYTVNGETFNISITGTLPVPPMTTGGSVTLTVNGQSYTTTFGGGVTPSPSPSPSPSPNPSPSPSASPANVVYETFTGTITNTGGSNVVAGAVTVRGTVYLPSLRSNYLTVSVVDPLPVNPPGGLQRTINMVRPNSPVGMPFALPGAGGFIDFDELTDTPSAGRSKKSFKAISGTATIVTAASDTLVVRFDNVVFTASSSEATGSFTLNGTFATRAATLQ